MKQLWTTGQLQQDFEVIGFCAPFVKVKRKSDNVIGMMEFDHMPRVYYDFIPDNKEEK